MAKGKQAALAASRRLEVANEHRDHLTDELVEAKLRARRYEEQARRLPIVEQALADAQADVVAGSSRKIRDLEARCQRLWNEREEMEHRLGRIEKAWEKLLMRVRQYLPPGPAGMEVLVWMLRPEDDEQEPQVFVDKDIRTSGRTKDDLTKLQFAKGERERPGSLSLEQTEDAARAAVANMVGQGSA